MQDIGLWWFILVELMIFLCLKDGGDGKVGRVLDVRGWDNESGNSVANVAWATGSTNVYRVGHKGKVDLRLIQSSVGGSYYRYSFVVDNVNNDMLLLKPAFFLTLGKPCPCWDYPATFLAE